MRHEASDYSVVTFIQMCAGCSFTHIHYGCEHMEMDIYCHIHLWSDLAFCPLFPMSCAVGRHHTVVSKDETKHDFVWQPVSGTALIHGNPAVNGELRGKELQQGRATQRERQRRNNRESKIYENC